MLLELALRRGGYDVKTVRIETPENLRRELAARCRDEDGTAHPWDIVIADYSMPRFDGFEALRILRETDDETPFILVSGTVAEEIAVAAMRAGAQDYLMKDNLTRLVPVVEREMREAQARRDRWHTQEALRESEERFRALVESSSEHIYMLDLNGNVLASNDKGCLAENLQDSRSLVGDHLSEVFPPEIAEFYETKLSAVIASKRGASFEIEVPTPGGMHHLFETLYPICRHDEVWAVGCISYDITKYKLLESKFRQAQKMEAIGTLSGGIAHDFNNLLLPILGYTEMALQKLEPQNPVFEDLNIVLESAHRAATLARQLLTFSHKQTLKLEILQLNHAIGDLAKMLRRIIGEDIELTVDLSADLGKVEADEGHLQQVLMNLAVNARDAMPDGGVLSIKTANITIDERYARLNVDVDPGDYVMLEVRDNGCGMDIDTKNRLFEPFFTTKGQGKGTGLGLPTVYGIIKQHDGFIQVDSRQREGTRFRIYLPLAEGEITEDPVPPRPTLELAGGKTILVVEDNEGVRNLTCAMLATIGCAVLSAASPREALALAKRHEGSISLLLTDVIMPEMNGQKLYRRLAQERPALKVLFMTGYADDTLLQTGIEEPATRVLQKPFTIKQLSGKVKAALKD